MSDASAASAPGSTDPRVVRSRTAVLQAARELVGERGIAATSIEAIAERAGVAKTTIYRHWRTKPEVVIDAISETLDPPADPDTGSLRGDLEALVRWLVDALTDGPLGALLTTVMDAAERDPEFAELHRREIAARHQVGHDVIGRAVQRGELPAGTDPDEVVALVTGPIFYRRLVTHGHVDRCFADAVVDRVLAAHGFASG